MFGMVRDIVIYPSDVLKRVAEEVRDIDGSVNILLEDMIETMYEKKGIGLAAPQVNASKRVIVFDVDWTEKKERNPLVLINPVIVEKEGEVESRERCLSLPGIADTVKRAKKVLVKGFDRSGKEVEIEADGLLSIVLQHEIDHLNGVVFIDHLSRLKRNFYLRRLMKRKKGGK